MHSMHCWLQACVAQPLRLLRAFGCQCIATVATSRDCADDEGASDQQTHSSIKCMAPRMLIAMQLGPVFPTRPGTFQSYFGSARVLTNNVQGCDKHIPEHLWRALPKHD
jgi:hypothetical protein